MSTAAVSLNSVALSTQTVSEKKNTARVHPLTSLFAGAVAGGVEAGVTYPFEYAKTSSQLRSQGKQGNAFQALRSVVASQGLSGIYTGCSALIVGTALKAGVRFLAFDTIKAQLADENGKLSTSGGILAGSVAGAVESILAVTPTERIKTALIDDGKGAKRFRSTHHAVGILIREQGIAGLYRGLVSTTIKQSATSAVRMGSYNTLKTQYANYIGHAPKTTPETFAIGACAGLITVYATQPFDTIKTRTQSSQGETLLRAARGVWVDGGVWGYWKGSGPRLGRLLLSGGIVFSVYERILTFLS
ncbi:hypothetical protein KCU83_g7196, partial [Aureobasidium melanogenum]